MSGLFKNIIYFFSIIFIHELGHFLMAKILGWKTDKIYFYPYGGFTKFNDDLNKPKKEELLIMIMGPIFQIIYYLVISKFLTNYELELFKNYHYSILFFNLLPIYPLDGGKLLNIICNYFLSFRNSFRFTIVLSYLVFSLVVIFLFYKNISFTLSFVMILVMIICKLTEELRKEKYYFNKFLLERYLNPYKFTKIKVINRLIDMKRDYKHVFFYKGKAHSEREELLNRFRQ